MRLQSKAASLVLVAVVLSVGLLLAARTRVDDGEDHGSAMILLDDLSATGARIDAELLRLSYGLEVSYDRLVRLQAEIHAGLQRLEERVYVRHPIPKQQLERRAVLVEDFKSEFSILRNSIAAVGALTQRSLARVDQDSITAQRLLRLENVVLRSLVGAATGSPELLAGLVSELDSRADLRSDPNWPLLKNHVALLASKKVRVARLLDDFFAVPLEAGIGDLRSALRADFESSVETSSRYGAALFVFAAVLLAFGVHKAMLARRYVVLLEESNETLERRVKERTQDLEQASRTKGEFLANMSHEIRTPMNIIIGMSGLTLETKLDDEQEDLVSTINKAAKSLLTILNDVLDFSKIESGKLVTCLQDFHVGPVVEETVDMFASLASEKGVGLHYTGSRGLPPFLRGDPDRLRQILTNLLGNALKFTEDGEVRIESHVTGRTSDRVTIRFEVHDTGIGIEPEAQKRLFQAFTQADGSTTRRYGGTGLGLAISKRLAEMMGGGIGLKSAVGEGSTFWFEIPFALGERSAKEDEEPDFGGLRALIADDLRSECKLLQSKLASLGMESDVAEGPMPAIEKMRAAARDGCPYDVLLLDYSMPGLNGSDVTRILKSDPATSDVPVAILTCHNEREFRDNAQAAGAAAFLNKPVQIRRLRDTLGRLTLGATAGDDPKPSSAADRLSMRLLLVEDNPDNRKLTVRYLEKHGIECDIAVNGQEAVEAVSRKRYPVVLMDCQMPEMDGFEATARIRQLEHGSRHTPIVAMTAYAMQGDRERCLEAGMDDYVAKPIDPTVLIQVIESWTSRGDDHSAERSEKSGGEPAETSEPRHRGEAVRVQARSELADLIPEYLDNRRAEIVALQEALKRSDTEAVEYIGHGLKGSGGAYGFKDLSEIGKKLERAAKDDDHSAIREHIRTLKEYMERLEVVYE